MPGPVFDQYLQSMTPPIFEGRTSNFSGPFNFQFGNPYAQMGSMMAAPFLQQLMGREGMLPLQFNPTQNMYDQFRAAQTYQSYQKSLQQASQSDRQTYEKLFRGMAQMSGTPWGLRQQQAASTMSQDIAGLAPMLAQLAPEMFDQIHGSRGSAVVAAHVLHRTGRHSLDPVTGRVGLSGDTVGTLSQELFRQLYGPDANLAEMRGMGAGQSALLYEQLLQRGMASPSIGRMNARDRVAALDAMPIDDATAEAIAKRAGISVEDVRSTQQAVRSVRAKGDAATDMDYAALERMSGMEDMLRTFDAKKISGRMKDLAGVVSAMRDIFGDAGRPDAPMREIIAGLEALTQGGMGTMSPARLESLVHETRTLAKQAGVTMDTVFGLNSQAAGMADQLGLDRSFALQSTQSALAFGQGMGISGRLDMPAFGSLDRDRATLLHQRLVLTAAASPAGNNLGALMRLADEGVLQERDADGNLTNAGRMIQAIRSGQSSFDYVGPDGRATKRSVVMNSGAFMGLLQESGLSAQQAGEAIRARHANQEYTRNYNGGDIIREGQAEFDGDRMVRAAFEQTLTQGARQMGGTEQEQLAMARGVAADIAKDMRGLDPEVYRDTAARNKALAQSIQKSFADRVRARALAAGAAPADAEAAAQNALNSLGAAGADGVRPGALQMAVGGWGSFDQFMSKTGYTSGIGYLQLQGDTVKKTAAAVRAEARTDAAIAQSLSGLGPTSPLARLMDTIMDAKSTDSLGKTVSKALGAADIKQLREDDPLIRGFVAAQQQFYGAERKDGLLTAAGIKQRESMALALKAINEGGVSVDQWLRQTQREFGITGEEVQSDKLRQAINASGMSAAEKEKMLAIVLAVDSARESTMRKRQEELGISTDTKISMEKVGTTIEQGKQASAAVAGMSRPKAGVEDWRTSEGYLKAGRSVRRFNVGSRDRLDQFLGSTADMEQLGRGGLEIMRGIEGKHSELERLAQQAGVTVDQLLMGDVDPKHAKLVATARTLQSGLQTDWDKVQKRQMGAKPTGAAAMTDAEKQLLAAEQEFRKLPGTPAEMAKAQAEQVTDELIKMVGGDKRTGVRASRDEIVEEIMSGDRQLGVFRGLEARKGLLKLAEKYKLIDPKDASSLDAQKKALEGLGAAGLSEDDRAAYNQLQKLYAPISEIGSDRGDETAEISEIIRRRVTGVKGADIKDAAKKEVAVTGTLTLKGLDKVLMKGAMVNNGVDAAPIATEPNFGGMPIV